MSESFNEGDRVCWNWGEGSAEGTVVEVFTDEVSRTLKGNEVTRKASTDCPAYLIRQDDGDEVLKSQSEIEAAWPGRSSSFG